MTKTPYALVATDLDGTLLRDDKSVSARTLSALAHVKNSGAEWLMVTGRPPRWMFPVMEQLGETDIVICANGSVWYSPAERAIVKSMPIPEDALRAAVELIADAVPDAGFGSEFGMEFGIDEGWLPHWPLPDDVQRLSTTELSDRPSVKLLVTSRLHTSEAFGQLARTLVGDLVEVVWSTTDTSDDRGLIEIGARGVHKGVALAEYAAERGLEQSDVVAFGDMPNDLEMLTWAGHGVAMSNGHPDVRKAADEITFSNQHDGVAVVLERLYRP